MNNFMIEINLLPKNYQKKSIDFSLGKSGVYGIAVAVGLILMFIGVTFYQQYQISALDQNIDKARQRAAMLEKDIRFVDALIDVKGKITMRMRAVERLDSHRSSWVHILEDVASNITEFVWLGKFQEKRPETAKGKDKGSTADKAGSKDKADAEAAEKEKATATAQSMPTVRPGEVEGYAFTLNALASFMIKMMRSDFFDEVELVSTNEMALQGKKAYNFVLSFNIHYLSDEEQQGLIASSGENDTEETKAGASHESLNEES